MKNKQGNETFKKRLIISAGVDFPTYGTQAFFALWEPEGLYE